MCPLISACTFLLPPTTTNRSIRKNGVALKGEFITGVGKGTPVSVNIELRKALGLYANVVHSFNIPG